MPNNSAITALAAGTSSPHNNEDTAHLTDVL